MSARRCRCCRIEETENHFIAPCNCDGNQRFVHKQCLSNVVRIFGQEKCPICRSPYKDIKIKQRLKGFCEYLKENEFRRLRTILSFVFFISFGFYSVLLGFSQFFHSKDILKASWIRVLILFVIKYSIVFVVASFWGLKHLRTAFLRWRVANPLIVITQATQN